MKSVLLRRFSLVILETVLLTAGAKAQAQMGPPSGTYEITSGGHEVTIPFRLIGTYVVLPAEVGGHEIGLILDTGMPANGILLHAGFQGDTYGLDYLGKARVMGADGQMVTADMAMGVSIRLPGLVLKDQMAIVVPYAIDRYVMFPREGMHGVIGLSLFDRFVVGIDYDKRVIVLAEPDYYTAPSDAEMLPLTLRDNIPFLACSAGMPDGSNVQMNLAVDSGHSNALALNVGAQPSIVVPSKAIETRIGVGATGELMGHVGRIPRLTIGRHTFENVVASFKTKPDTGRMAREKEGNLGAEVLRRFKVTFDYKNERMIVEPGESIADPFEHDMSGLELSRLDDGSFAVDRIAPGSAAEEAGLGIQDVIVKIMGRPAGDVGLMEFKEILKAEGRDVTLELARDGERRTVALKLRRLI
jgi:hypothetical protein